MATFEGKKADGFLNVTIVLTDGTEKRLSKGVPLSLDRNNDKKLIELIARKRATDPDYQPVVKASVVIMDSDDDEGDWA